jgi:pimeloyl-ACP methyl ester carboxylesterase
MDSGNVAAFSIAEQGVEALEQLIAPRAAAIRADPVSHLPFAVEDLPASDRRVISNFKIRGMLSSNFSEAFRHSSAGWVDDVLSFVSSWTFDPGRIRVPTLIWHGGRDALIPVRHACWLEQQIGTAKLQVQHDAGHFGAVEALPDALHWLGSGADGPD